MEVRQKKGKDGGSVEIGQGREKKMRLKDLEVTMLSWLSM